MRRILFSETDFNSLPNPPAGFKYIGFDGPNFSEKSDDGQISQSIGGTGATGPQGPTGPAGSGGSASSDRLISSNVAYNLEAILDENGTLNTPLLLPLSFTAVCDESHYDGSPNFSDTNWWEFEVHFVVSQDGTVETQINNIFPILTNPGYVSGDTFIFTEADHGIPGFNFEIVLMNVVLPGGAGWTANLGGTQPPDYPSTIKSLGAIKLTADTNSFVLGTDGSIDLPRLTVNLHNGDNQTAQTLRFADASTQAVITTATPLENNSAQRIIIQGARATGTGEGGDVYFWGGDADVDGGDIKIYAGDADSNSEGYGGYVNIAGGRGHNVGGHINLTAGNSDLQAGDITLTPGYSQAGNHGEVLIQTNNNYFRFNRDGQFTMPSGASIISSNFTGADGENAVLGQYDGHTQIYTMQNGVGIQTHDSGSYSNWNFGSTGDLTLPEGGDILDYLGNSVLSGISMTEVTHSELLDLVNSSSLIASRYYKITDFRTCYDQPDFDVYGNGVTSSNTYHQSDIDPIIVFATSDSTLDSSAYQPSYSNDKIKYDISWTQSEVTGGTAYGRITERIDDLGNRTDYDHRTILFKRYKTRILNGTKNGRILSVNDGLVIGTNSTFTGDFVTGSVVFIESDNPNFYKVLSVTSDTEMLVEGRVMNNFSDSNGYPYEDTRVESNTISGCLYYFNDAGSDDIDDGGDDMYDGANRLNTNLYSQIPYTHTQMSTGNDYQQAELSDFTYDGTIQDGSTYFGASSSYFTNLYPGLFVMSAYGVDVTDFSISGNLGSDGDGQCEGDRFEWEGFTIFTKIVHSAAYDGETDPSIAHIIIVDTIDPNITHSFDPTTSNDDDSIGNLSNVSTIHYLLFGLSLGVKPTAQQIQDVYQSYLNLVDNVDINQTLSSLNSNFSQITDNLPANQRIYSSLEVKLPNIIGDELDYREILTFDTETNVIAKNNYLGNTCDVIVFFMLPNNVFTNSYGNNVEVHDNIFGNRFRNNSFGDDVYANNILGNEFSNNIFYDRFYRNTIKYNFYSNIFYNLEFARNIVGGEFSNNLFMGGNQIYNNNIDNNFSYNKFFSNSSFYNNVIPFEFNSNKIFSQFYSNQLSYFNSNTIYDNFYLNICGPEFTSNTIGSILNTGAFSRNHILSNFQSNTIGINFSYNTIGNYFTNNIIGDDFGFGGGQARGNKIGNYFNNNTIGEYFYDNITADVFESNIIGDNFKLNDIKVQNFTGVDFTTYQGNIVSFINLTPGISATDGVYNNLSTTTNGNGQGATFDVTVSGGQVTLVQLNNAGKFYLYGNNLQIASASFAGSSNIELSVSNETSPVVYMPTNTTILKDIYGDNRLQYLDTGGFVFTTVNGLLVP